MPDAPIQHDAAEHPTTRSGERTPRRRIGFGLRGLLTSAAILVVAVVGTLLALLNSPLLEIQQVDVEGANVVSAASVRQLAGLAGEHVVLADFDAAASRISALPMVRDVVIHRNWPNGATIVIVERTPWGRWQADGAVWPIDADGVVLEGAAPSIGGPIVQQMSAQPAVKAGATVDLDAIRMAEELHQRGAPLPLPAIVAFEWSLADGLTVLTEHGRIVFGGSDGLDYKYQVWELLEREAMSRSEPLLFADLRFGLRPRVEIGLNEGRGVRLTESSAADLSAAAR